MADPVVLVYSDAFNDASYDFGPDHPLQPIRVELAVRLIGQCGLLDAPGVSRLDPRPATREELSAVHDPSYIAAVETLGAAGMVPQELSGLAAAHGFRSSDNPVFAEMQDAAALVAGGTVVAAEAVMSGRAVHAFAPAGGLHHAHRARASGFCIYNDPAVAIADVRARYGARVAYIDVDAHHGDGVQGIFYDDPNVLTFSLHESGRYLFPGTGFIEERGEGAGYGYSANVPLEPYTTDLSILQAVRDVAVPLVRAFKPDLIVTQCGCDTHTLDPLTHFMGTTSIWPKLARIFDELAHALCEGRWLATGGGGYDLYSVVPRAWTMLFAGMVGVDLPKQLPEPFLALRGRYSQEPMATTFADAEHPEAPAQVHDANTRTIQRAREVLFPLLGVGG